MAKPVMPENRQPAASGSKAAAVVALGLSLAVCLLAVRGCVVEARWGHGALAYITRILVGGSSDVAYATTITAFAAGLALLLRRRWQGRVLCAAFLLIGVISALAAWINVKAVQMIGRPFTYPWLVYADFFRSRDGQAALAASCTPDVLAWFGAQVAALLVLAFALGWGLKRLARHRLSRVLGGIAVVVLGCVYFPWSWNHPARRHLVAGKTANPVVEFTFSFVKSYQMPALFTMKTPFAPDDVRVAGERGGAGQITASRDFPAARGKIRNVVVFVLESLAARYTDAHDAAYGVTPRLAACRSRAMRFENAYAHRPSTPNSLVSLLCSLYPPPDLQSITTDYNAAPLEALSDVLKRRGYRTGWFNSGDLKYGRGGEFLARHSFDVLQDFRDRPGELLLTDSEQHPPAATGTDDVCTVEYAHRWMSRGGAQPFFAVIWTDMTHYPYHLHGEELPIVDRADVPGQMLNRYLNALRRTDEAFGRCLRLLREAGLEDSTLVMAVGDHGEAFGRHGTYGHASGIYEENVHVPLMLIHPALFHGESNPAVCGLVDLAPTVLHLLDVPVPGSWQGRSLYDSKRPERVYFQCPYSECLLGYREGSRTLLYNGSTGTHELYDLATDPLQTKNLIHNHPDLAHVMEQRIAAWVQYQMRLMTNIRRGLPPWTLPTRARE